MVPPTNESLVACSGKKHQQKCTNSQVTRADDHQSIYDAIKDCSCARKYAMVQDSISTVYVPTTILISQ